MASVPAWKRLGLKLKGSSGSEPSAATAPAAAAATTAAPSSAPYAKRKYDSATGSNNTPLRSSLRGNDSATTNPGFKKARYDSGYSNTDSSADSRRKSVSFSADTNIEPRTAQPPTPAKKPKKPKSKKPKAAGSGTSAASSTVTTDITPSLEYLRLWKTARSAWKFNKNHQTLLIKYVYDNHMVPARDMAAFYDYIRDIQGYARVRLLEVAHAVQKADMEHVTGEAPAPGSAAVPPTAAQMAANVKYHVRLAECMRELGVQGDKNGSKHIDETKIEAGESGAEGVAMVKRIVRRMRAEAIIAELADGTETPAARPTDSQVEAKAIVEEKAEEERPEVKPAPPVQAKANTKKSRSRKKRVMADDSDSSSSESDSDSSDSDSD
ncbi:proteasome subunit alpha type 6 [Ceratocystis lukuohia]|uniref:Proteasome subunit alpha type 6 n=1 Tax=Ceratocystis lukuohia TaxID=2019550 RepID=A0ABR4M9W4_9PEZI